MAKEQSHSRVTSSHLNKYFFYWISKYIKLHLITWLCQFMLLWIAFQRLRLFKNFTFSRECLDPSNLMFHTNYATFSSLSLGRTNALFSLTCGSHHTNLIIGSNYIKKVTTHSGSRVHHIGASSSRFLKPALIHNATPGLCRDKLGGCGGWISENSCIEFFTYVLSDQYYHHNQYYHHILPLSLPLNKSWP